MIHVQLPRAENKLYTTRYTEVTFSIKNWYDRVRILFGGIIKFHFSVTMEAVGTPASFRKSSCGPNSFKFNWKYNPKQVAQTTVKTEF